LLGSNHEKEKSVTLEPEYAEMINIIKELSKENKKLLREFLEFTIYRNEKHKSNDSS